MSSPTVGLQKNKWVKSSIYLPNFPFIDPCLTVELSTHALPWHIKNSAAISRAEDHSELAWCLIQSIWWASWHWLSHNQDTTIKPIWLWNFELHFIQAAWLPLPCSPTSFKRGEVELCGKRAGVTLTVSCPHRQSAQIPFLVGTLVNTSTSHTSHFTALEREERCEVRDWKTTQASAAGTSCYPAEFIWMHFISCLLGFSTSIWARSASSRWHVHSPWKVCFV